MKKLILFPLLFLLVAAFVCASDSQAVYNNSGDYYDGTNSTSFTGQISDDGTWSIAVDVKTGTTGTTRAVYGPQTTGSPGKYHGAMYVNTLDKFTFYSDSADGATQTANGFSANDWYRVLVVVNAGDKNLYTNSSVVGNASVSSANGADYDATRYIADSGLVGTNWDGYIYNYTEWDFTLNSTEISNYLECGETTTCVIPPPTPENDEYVERTTEVLQVGTVGISSTSYTNVVNGTFNLSNATNVIASWTLDVDNRIATSVSCRALIDGEELNTEVNRTFTSPNSVASLFVYSNNLSLGAGEHWSALQCKKNTGSSFFNVDNGKGIIHILYNDDGNNLTFDAFSLSTNLTSSSWTNLGTVQFNTSGLNSSGLNREVTFEGSINYEYVSTSNISFRAEVNGINTTTFERYGVAGSSGSGGGLFISYNHTANETVNFTLYGKSSSADGGASFNIAFKEFITHNEEVNNSLAESISINTTPKIISNITLNNTEHIDANIVAKVVSGVRSTSGDQDVFMFLGNDAINESINTRSIIDAGAGIVILQNVFDSIGVGTHNINVWAYTSSGNAVIDNSTLIGYVTDDIPFNATIFEVRAFDSWDNSSIINFNVTDALGNVFISNASGVATVVPYTLIQDLTISTNTDYFNVTISNHQTTDDLNVSLNQSIISFDSFEKITGNSLSSSFNVSDGSIWKIVSDSGFVGLKAGSYNVTAITSGYFDKVVSFSVVILDNKTVNVSDIFDVVFNLSAEDAWFNTSISSFNSTVSYGSFSEFGSTSNGTIIFGLLDRFLYGFSSNSVGYALTSSSGVNVSSNFTVRMYTDNSILLRARNTLTNDVILNVSYTLIGPNGTISGVINASEIIIQNLSSGTYQIIANKTGFGTFVDSLLVGDDIITNETVFLNPDAEEIIFLVKNAYQQFIGDALITVTRANDGVIMGSKLTDFTGAASFELIRGIDYYVNVSKSGFLPFFERLTPVTTEVTIDLTFDQDITPPPYVGIIVDFSPSGDLTNNSFVDFSVDYNSSFYPVTDCSFIIYDENNSVLFTNSSCPGSSGSLNLFNVSVADNSGLTSVLVLELNSSQNISYRKVYGVSDFVMGDFTLAVFIEDLRGFEGAGFGDSTRWFIAVLFIVLTTFGITRTIDLFAEPERVMLLVWALTGIVCFVNFMPLSFLNVTDPFIIQYGVFFLVSLLTLASLFIAWRSNL